MSDVDWRGVALALSQLKDIAGPTDLEKMRYQHDLSEGGKQKQRDWDAKEKQKERTFDMQKEVFKYQYDEYQDNETQILALQNSIYDISAEGQKLTSQYKSGGMGFLNALEDNEKKPMERRQTANEQIEQSVGTQLDEITRLTTINNNMEFGQALRETEGATGYQRAQELYDAGRITLDQYNRAQNIDLDGQYGVSHGELKMALMNTLDMMESAGIPSDGIEEGYWAEYKGQTGRELTELTFQEQVLDTAAAAYKEGAKAWKAGEGIEMPDGTAHTLIEEYLNMEEFMTGGYADGKQKKMTKKEQERYQQRMGEIVRDLAGANRGEDIESLFDTSIKWNVESQNVEYKNQQFFSTDMTHGYEKEGFGKDVYGALIHYNVYQPNTTHGSEKQRNENLLMRREYTFMVKNWDKHIDRLNEANPTTAQKRFNESYALFRHMKENGYFEKYSTNNPYGKR